MMTATNNQLPYFNINPPQGRPQKMDNSSFLNVSDRSATSGMTDVSVAAAGVANSRVVREQPRSRTNINQKQKRLKRPPVFPLQLYDMLTDAEKDPALQSIVSWLPDGKSFLVHNEKSMDYVLERYFKGIKMSSFTRQLQIYGFARYKGVCTHVLLQRGQRHLLRNKSLDDFQSLSLNKKDSNRGGSGGRTSTTSPKSTPPAEATSVDPQAITGMSTTAAALTMPAPAPLSVMMEQDRQKQQQQLLQQEFGTIAPAVVSQSSANSISASSSSSSSSSGDVFDGKWDDLSWLSGVVDLEPLQNTTSKTTTTNNMTAMPTTAANIVDDSSSSRQSSRFSSSSSSSSSQQQQQQEQHIFEPSTSSFDALIESMDLDAQFGDDVALPMRFAHD